VAQKLSSLDVAGDPRRSFPACQAELFADSLSFESSLNPDGAKADSCSAGPVLATCPMKSIDGAWRKEFSTRETRRKFRV
jgi:hypothetical protein